MQNGKQTNEASVPVGRACQCRLSAERVPAVESQGPALGASALPEAPTEEKSRR